MSENMKMRPTEGYEFNPDSGNLAEQIKERGIVFQEAFYAFATGKTSSAKAGAETAKAFIRFVESVHHLDPKERKRIHERIIQVVEDIIDKPSGHRDSRIDSEESRRQSQIFLSGWKSEASAAFAFHEAGYNVSLSTVEQEGMKIDLWVEDSEDSLYMVQVKSLSLNKPREIAESMPIVNSIGRVEELMDFYDRVSKMCVSFEIKIDGKRVDSLPPDIEELSSDTITFSLTLDSKFTGNNFMNTNDSLSALCHEALETYKSARKVNTPALLYIVNGGSGEGSDILNSSFELCGPAKEVFLQDLDGIRPEAEKVA